MKKKNFLIALLSIVVIQLSAQVKVYEGVETIPTHKLAEDVKSPIFYTGRGVQGAAGKMYPYAAQTNLQDKLVDIDYKMVYLENEYTKVTLLPSYGGKIYRATDKTNGYEIIHSNTTMKYDLIGTLGAWVSGGIEWCFPNHHRTSTLLPTDYTIQKHDDGSVTVWLGETERVLRLRAIVGITLRPGCSYFEVEYRINNTTELPKTFLFWANASMTANENYRTFFPPNQEVAVDHNNREFYTWPYAKEDGVNYKKGDDLTWWKNHPSPQSFFFWQGKEGFIGGYDYGVNAGSVHVGNPYINKTSKLFQFGPGLQGQAYRRKLTDDGKAYVELMTGSYSNNQPGYSWIAPHSVKDATNFWYGIRDLEVVKNANIDAAVTLQMRDPQTVFYGFNTTREFKNAKITLSYKGDILNSESIDINPSKPFTATYKNKEVIDEYELFVKLTDSEGKELISYKPFVPTKPELPEVQEKVKPVEEIETVEDLYLTGRFVEQFHRPFHNADDYYFAALEKLPTDYRVNLSLGTRRVKQMRYAEGLEYLQKAADKLKVKYYLPKESELFYYLGLAQKALGLNEEAYANFYQSTWYYEWFSSGYYQLALLESKNGNYSKALDMIQRAYSTNNNDGRIVVLYTALLRKLNQKDEALALIDKFLDFDPISYPAYFEKGLLTNQSLLEEHQKNMQDKDNNYLDIAVNYSNAGMYEDGLTLLTSIDNPQNPLVYYYLAWFYANTNQASKVKEILSIANSKSFDYCFPYRSETEEVLKFAVKEDPKNYTAYYLLGNLLFDNRKEDAIAAWENVGEINPEVPMVWRNLAFAAFHHENKVEKAINLILRAIEDDKTQPLWFAEMAKYYDHSTRDYKECLSLLQENIDVVKIDAGAPKSVVKLLNLEGEYDEAIEMLSTHHFRTWEGGRVIHSYYVDAHTLRALRYMNETKYDEAIEDLEAAKLYPVNLEVGKSKDDGRNAMIHYLMGVCFEKKGKKKTAKQYFEWSANTDNSKGDLKYYQALATLKLNNNELANELFQKIIKEGQTLIERGAAVSGIGVDEASTSAKSNSSGYYLQALGEKGMGNESKSKELLKKSLKEYQNNLWAKFYSMQ